MMFTIRYLLALHSLRFLISVPALLLVLAISFAAIIVPTAAHAAIGAESCTGIINTLPFTINTQGTWCFRSDLATSMTDGNAITINANNVTVDCLDYKLGGAGAGPGTNASGISADNRLNVTVRNCNIRGFYVGVYFTGLSGGGHTVENNRLDKNTSTGISVEGNSSVVRRNRVSSTGTSTSAFAHGIEARRSVDVIDNTISGVAASVFNAGNIGIFVQKNPDGQIKGNRVRGVVPAGPGATYAINIDSSARLTLRNNDLVGDGSANTTGLKCSTELTAHNVAIANVVKGFETGMFNCLNEASNVVLP